MRARFPKPCFTEYLKIHRGALHPLAIFHPQNFALEPPSQRRRALSANERFVYAAPFAGRQRTKVLRRGGHFWACRSPWEERTSPRGSRLRALEHPPLVQPPHLDKPVAGLVVGPSLRSSLHHLGVGAKATHVRPKSDGEAMSDVAQSD